MSRPVLRDDLDASRGAECREGQRCRQGTQPSQPRAAATGVTHPRHLPEYASYNAAAEFPSSDTLPRGDRALCGHVGCTAPVGRGAECLPVQREAWPGHGGQDRPVGAGGEEGGGTSWGWLQSDAVAANCSVITTASTRPGRPRGPLLLWWTAGHGAAPPLPPARPRQRAGGSLHAAASSQPRAATGRGRQSYRAAAS